jgi:hypothetical protein
VWISTIVGAILDEWSDCRFWSCGFDFFALLRAVDCHLFAYILVVSRLDDLGWMDVWAVKRGIEK